MKTPSPKAMAGVNIPIDTNWTEKVVKSDAEWKKILSPDLYAVAREADTERAFTGKMWNDETKGTYYCATCGYKLFQSNQKFTSSCGWPSFFEQENKESIVFKLDKSYGMIRTEALCGRCNLSCTGQIRFISSMLTL